MTTTAIPTAVQINFQKLTNILDAASATWSAVLAEPDNAERLNLLRIHAKQLRQYFKALETTLSAPHGTE